MGEEISKLRKVRWGRGDFKSAQHIYRYICCCMGVWVRQRSVGNFILGLKIKCFCAF